MKLKNSLLGLLLPLLKQLNLKNKPTTSARFREQSFFAMALLLLWLLVFLLVKNNHLTIHK